MTTLRRDTAARWTSFNPVLRDGELGYEKNTGKLKIGDGSSPWSVLGYFSGDVSGGDQLTLGDVESALADGSIVLAIAATHRALYAKTTSITEHAATIHQAATSGTGVALNVISDNPDDSAMYLSGKETTRGTLKIAHNGYADASDAGASGLSIDTRVSGSGARGIYLWSTEGGQTGDSITVRRSAAATSLTREDFVVKASGRCGIGIGLGSTPAAQLEIALPDDTTPGLSVRGRAAGTNQAEFRRPSDGAVRTRISSAAQLVTQEIAYFAGPAVQVGSTSVQVGGGSGVIGITNAGTVPTTDPSGGGVLYAEGGELKWRSSAGVVTTITPAFPPSYQTPAFVNSWRNFDTGANPTWSPVRYWKNASGELRISGTLANGVALTSGTTSIIFNLPSAYRPSRAHIRQAVATNTPHRVDIQTDGNVVINPNGSPAIGTWFTVDWTVPLSLS